MGTRARADISNTPSDHLQPLLNTHSHRMCTRSHADISNTPSGHLEPPLHTHSYPTRTLARADISNTPSCPLEPPLHTFSHPIRARPRGRSSNIDVFSTRLRRRLAPAQFCSPPPLPTRARSLGRRATRCMRPTTLASSYPPRSSLCLQRCPRTHCLPCF